MIESSGRLLFLLYPGTGTAGPTAGIFECRIDKSVSEVGHLALYEFFVHVFSTATCPGFHTCIIITTVFISSNSNFVSIFAVKNFAKKAWQNSSIVTDADLGNY